MARKHSARRTHRRRATHKRRHTRRSHTRRQQKQQRKQQRGGMAPVNYDLARGWSSEASLAQGDDFTKYHAQQHGGSAPYPAAVSGAPFLPPAGTAIAMTGSLDRALADVAGLKDPQPTLYVDAAGRMGAPTTQDSPGAASMARGVPEAQPQAGGKRRKHGRKHGRKTHKGRKGHKGSRKHHSRRSHRSRRHRGGGLGFAPVGAPGLLLPSKVMYDEAGLNPDYRGAATEYAIAEIRDQQ